MGGWDWDVMVGWLVAERMAAIFLWSSAYFDTVILAIVCAVPLPLGLFYCFRVKVFGLGMSVVHCICV